MPADVDFIAPALSTEDLIRAAIQQLEDEGTPFANIRATKVRDITKRGSLTTIQRVLGQVRASRGMQQDGPQVAQSVKDLAVHLLQTADSAESTMKAISEEGRALELAVQTVDVMRSSGEEASKLRSALEQAVTLAEMLQEQVVVLQEEVIRQRQVVDGLQEKLHSASGEVLKTAERFQGSFDSINKRMMLAMDSNMQLVQEPLRIERARAAEMNQTINALRQKVSGMETTIAQKDEEMRRLRRLIPHDGE